MQQTEKLKKRKFRPVAMLFYILPPSPQKVLDDSRGFVIHNLKPDVKWRCSEDDKAQGSRSTDGQLGVSKDPNNSFDILTCEKRVVSLTHCSQED
jgi:hypothetical protein